MSRISFYSHCDFVGAPLGAPGARQAEPLPEYSSAQIQLDAAIDGFSSEASDPFSIASMTLVGLVGKLARVGILSAFSHVGANNYLPLRNILSHLGSVGAEAATLTGISRGGSPWLPSFRQDLHPQNRGQARGPAPTTQDFLSHFINFATFRMFGFLGAASGAPTIHFIQSAGMVAGHQMASAFGLEEHSHESFAQQFFEANISTLQIGFGNLIGKHFSAGRLEILERSLGEKVLITPIFRRENSVSILGREEVSPRLSMRSSESIQTFTQNAARLEEAYNVSGFAREGINSIKASLQFIYRMNAANTSSGSFRNALLHEVVGQALAIGNASFRNLILREVFHAMQRGLGYNELYLLASTYAKPDFQCSGTPQFSAGFAEAHLGNLPTQGAHSWENFKPQHRNLLLNYIEHVAGNNPIRAQRLIHVYGEVLNSSRYSRELIEEVLNHALQSPLGEYILRRFTFIVGTQDVAAKLYELRPLNSMLLDENIPTPRLIYEMCMRGMNVEKIAQTINGSMHTAYLEDIRIARKVTLFYRELVANTDLPNRRHERITQLATTFRAKVLPRWEKQKILSTQDLIDLLETNSSPHFQSFLEAYRKGNFEIQILEGSKFDQRVNAGGVAIDCHDAYIILKPAPEKTQILLRRFEIGDIHNTSERDDAFNNILTLLPYLIHEWEHWRHFGGHYHGPETGGHPYNKSLNRENRMGSEMLSFLEENLWRTLHHHDQIFRNIVYFGDPIVTYFRSLADATYYTNINERLARELIP